MEDGGEESQGVERVTRMTQHLWYLLSSEARKKKKKQQEFWQPATGDLAIIYDVCTSFMINHMKSSSN
jgi:hypothetical protein